MISGAIQPIFGYVMSEQLFLTTQKHDIWGVDYKKEIPANMAWLCFYVVLISIGLFIFIGLRFYSYGTLAMRLTFKMRQRVYGSILQKNIAFFETEGRDTQQLTEVLENDCEMLNGASIEALGPIVEASSAIAMGLILCIYEERDMLIYCIPAFPLFIYSSYFMWRYQQGLYYSSDAFVDEINDFSNEMIANFKTAQSFGHMDKILKKYEDLLG